MTEYILGLIASFILGFFTCASLIVGGKDE